MICVCSICFREAVDVLRLSPKEDVVFHDMALVRIGLGVAWNSVIQMHVIN
jgi:thymidine kinase